MLPITDREAVDRVQVSCDASKLEARAAGKVTETKMILTILVRAAKNPTMPMRMVPAKTEKMPI